MTVVAHDLGQVLVQRPAEADVEQLRPPAHPEHRQAHGEGAVEHRQLRGVAVGMRGDGTRVRRRAVAVGRDVRAAAEQHTVEPIDRARDPGDRREQHRHPAPATTMSV